MMTWTSTAPDGAQSVKANRTILGNNTLYIENTMGKTANDTTNSDAIRDHYWAVDSNLDGRHRYINMPAYTISGAIADPVIGASCQSVTYTKTKTALESAFQQDVQPFFRNGTGIMQILGIRACILFDLTPASPITDPPTCTVKYSHNAELVAGGLGVVNNARTFQLNFSPALPSPNYFVYADSIPRATSTHQIPIVSNSNTLADVKAENFLKMTLDPSNNSSLPLQIWVVCFGG